MLRPEVPGTQPAVRKKSGAASRPRAKANADPAAAPEATAPLGQPVPADGVADFLGLLSDGRRVLAAGAAGLSPVVAALIGFSPPEPRHLTEIAGLLAVFVSMINYQGLTRLPSRRRDWRLKVAGFAFVAALACYLLLFLTFTVELKEASERLIIGCGYRSDFAAMAAKLPRSVGSGCPGEVGDFLASAQYDPRRIWTTWSVSAVSVLLVALWLTLVAAVSVGVSTFVYGLRENKQ